MPQNNDSTDLVLSEIRSLRSEMNENFRETRGDIQQTNVRINETDKHVAKIDKKVAVNKTKIGFMVSLILALGEAVKHFIR